MAKKRKQLIDVRHPFFCPVWRRVATTALTGGWAAFELAIGNTFWAVLFGALAAYCLYEFFIVYDPADYEEPDS